MRQIIALLAATLIVLPPSAMAQSADATAGANDDIVVTAVPADPAQLRKEVSNFVGRVAQTADQGQMSRRNSAFCPKVLGLEDRYRDIVLGHIRDAAKAAGVRELAAGCETNLLLIFTTNGDALMDALRSKKPGFFVRLHPQKSKELFKSGRAVRWWYENAGKDANGNNVGTAQDLNVGASVDQLNYTTVYSASLINTQVRVNLSGNVVVIDVTRAEGFPLDAIASYAAMVSFAQVSARDNVLGEAPSVLAMFTRPQPRIAALRELTIWDRAYLRGLYRIASNQTFAKQRRRLTTAMRDAIVQPELTAAD